MTIQLYH